MTGLLVALEGIDGAGTTTSLAPLGRFIEEQGFRVVTTCEPSSGVVGQLIRRVLRAEEKVTEATLALLFAADRLDHLEKVILPALQAGAVVVTDRYLLSSLAYQAKPPLTESWVRHLNARAPSADVSFVFRVRYETAHARRLARGGRAERFDGEEDQRFVAGQYNALAAEDDKIISVDAERTAEAVLQTLQNHVARFLELHKNMRDQARTPKVQ